MSGNTDDIDKQMAAIDKAMADMPETPEAQAVPARTKRVTPATVPEGGRREVVSVCVPSSAGVRPSTTRW